MFEMNQHKRVNLADGSGHQPNMSHSTFTNAIRTATAGVSLVAPAILIRISTLMQPS